MTLKDGRLFTVKAVMCAAPGAAELAPQSPAPEATGKETHARSAIDETLAPT
ncbi:MAG: hypothetical protein IKO43_05360 [Kiritimatiellae bacterium]|nr:hypothetical protein [Kiritimatiellia bacterium]